MYKYFSCSFSPILLCTLHENILMPSFVLRFCSSVTRIIMLFLFLPVLREGVSSHHRYLYQLTLSYGLLFLPLKHVQFSKFIQEHIKYYSKLNTKNLQEQSLASAVFINTELHCNVCRIFLFQISIS